MGMAEMWIIDSTAPPHCSLDTCTPTSVHRKCLSKKRKETVARDWKNYTLRSFTICTTCQILIGQFKSRRMRSVEGYGGVAGRERRELP
jgi:hypothetical protein